MSRLERLQKAGLIADPERLTEAQKKAIETLTDHEIKVLIDAAKKISQEHLEKLVELCNGCY